MTWGVRPWGTRAWANGGTDPTPSGTLTATGDATLARVQLAVSWSGAQYVNIYRVQDGTWWPVRTAQPVDNTTGSSTVYDYEVPLDTSVYYVAVSPSLAFQRLLSSTVTVASSDKTWLSHPTQTSLNRVVCVTGQPERTRPIDRGVFPVPGRARPVVVTSGIRQATTGTLTLYAATLAERDDILALLADGSPLLLRCPTGYGWEASSWIAVADVVETPTTSMGYEPRRVLALPFVEVDPPSLSAALVA